MVTVSLVRSFEAWELVAVIITILAIFLWWLELIVGFITGHNPQPQPGIAPQPLRALPEAVHTRAGGARARVSSAHGRSPLLQ